MASAGTARTSLFEKISESLSSLGGSEAAIGLSLGSSSIKLVELKKSGKTWKLIHFGMVQLPDEVIVNREITNNIAVVESLKTLIHQLKLKSKSVCTALSGTSLIIKRMTLEVANAREIQDQVFWEAEQYLPFDVSEVVMDFQILSRAKDNKTDVLLVAVKRSVLDSYMSCISEAGLKAKVVDVDFFALQNLFEANYPVSPSEAVAIVDVGATSLKLVIVHGGIPVFTKDSSLGGRNATVEIQRQLNLSFVDAETLKVSGQQNAVPQEVSELLRMSAENIATDIKRSIDFYNASSNKAPVSYILLAGGGAKLSGLSKVVEDTVGLPTQMINPFNAISYDPEIFTPDYVAAIAPIAAIPLGLALRAGAGK